jgi:serine/threonine-protein kinase
VREKREITVFVSTGIKTAEMPNVVKQEHRAAVIALRQLDLNLVIDDATEEYDDNITAGYVIRSSPAEGEMLQDGDVVMLVLSKGPKVIKATVTTLTDRTLEQAQKNVSELGLVCAVDYAYDDNVPADFVISQSIAPLTEVAQGSTIRLTVSLGPEPPSEPDPAVTENPEGEQEGGTETTAPEGEGTEGTEP